MTRGSSVSDTVAETWRSAGSTRSGPSWNGAACARSICRSSIVAIYPLLTVAFNKKRSARRSSALHRVLIGSPSWRAARASNSRNGPIRTAVAVAIDRGTGRDTMTFRTSLLAAAALLAASAANATV